ncbi:MAG: hypothetical protein AABO58_15130 [Acidobacteriota bacterium]
MNRRLLVLLTAVLCLSCSTIYDDKGVGPKGNPCAKYTPLSSSNRPIICVDDRNLSKLTTNPYETWAKKNSPIRWYTVTGAGGLTITFDDAACVNQDSLSKCYGGASCEATLTSGKKPGEKCTYSITVSRGDQTSSEDPIIIIDTGMYDDKALEPPSQ